MDDFEMNRPFPMASIIVVMSCAVVVMIRPSPRPQEGLQKLESS